MFPAQIGCRANQTKLLNTGQKRLTCFPTLLLFLKLPPCLIILQHKTKASKIADLQVDLLLLNLNPEHCPEGATRVHNDASSMLALSNRGGLFKPHCSQLILLATALPSCCSALLLLCTLRKSFFCSHHQPSIRPWALKSISFHSL